MDQHETDLRYLENIAELLADDRCQMLYGMDCDEVVIVDTKAGQSIGTWILPSGKRMA